MTLQQLEANLGLVFLGDLGAAQRIIDWVKAHNAVLANQDKQQLAQAQAARTICDVHQAEFDRLEEQVTNLTDKLASETAIVSRVWAALGVTTYEQAHGKSIDELVTDLTAKLVQAQAEGLENISLHDTATIQIIQADRGRVPYLEQQLATTHEHLECVRRDLYNAVEREHAVRKELATVQAEIEDWRKKFQKALTP